MHNLHKVLTIIGTIWAILPLFFNMEILKVSLPILLAFYLMLYIDYWLHN